MEEVWKDIPRYVGAYQVSNLGRVRSLDRQRTGRGGVRQITYGKILSATKMGKKDWYMQVTLFNKGIREYALVHRLVAQVFIKNPDNKKEVNHKNGVKNDNRSDNLEWATRKENATHASKIKLYRRGSLHPHTKINESTVREIRTLLRSGVKHVHIAKKLSVNVYTVRDINRGRTWGHIL